MLKWGLELWKQHLLWSIIKSFCVEFLTINAVFFRRGGGGLDYRSTKSSRYRVQMDSDDIDGDGDGDASNAAAGES